VNLEGVRVVELADEQAEYCGQVLAGLGATLGAAVALADLIAFLAVAGADAAAVVAIAKMRQIDSAYGNRDEVLALFADQFAFGEELAKVLAYPAFDDLPEALVIFVNLEDHGNYFSISVTPSCDRNIELTSFDTFFFPPLPASFRCTSGSR